MDKNLKINNYLKLDWHFTLFIFMTVSMIINFQIMGLIFLALIIFFFWLI